METSTDFEKLIRDKTDEASSKQAMVVVVGAIPSIVAIVLLYNFFPFEISELYIGCFMFFCFTFLFSYYIPYVRNKGITEDGGYWATMIKENPENIVWIKPVIYSEKLYGVITIKKTQQYCIYTKDRHLTAFSIMDENEHRIFLEGIACYLLHAQFGYSSDVAAMYNDNPQQFIEALKFNKLYTPISSYKLE